MNENDPLHQLQVLKAYFLRIAEEDPNLGQYQRGYTLCQNWESLISQSELRENQIEEFLDRIYQEATPGSGWLELSFQFKLWARSKGFKAYDRTYSTP